MKHVKELIEIWKDEAIDMDNRLQVGRCGDDDGTYSHGVMNQLEECLEDLMIAMEKDKENGINN